MSFQSQAWEGKVKPGELERNNPRYCFCLLPLCSDLSRSSGVTAVWPWPGCPNLLHRVWRSLAGAEEGAPRRPASPRPCCQQRIQVRRQLCSSCQLTGTDCSPKPACCARDLCLGSRAAALLEVCGDIPMASQSVLIGLEPLSQRFWCSSLPHLESPYFSVCNTERRTCFNIVHLPNNSAVGVLIP